MLAGFEHAVLIGCNHLAVIRYWNNLKTKCVRALIHWMVSSHIYILIPTCLIICNSNCFKTIKKNKNQQHFVFLLGVGMLTGVRDLLSYICLSMTFGTLSSVPSCQSSSKWPIKSCLCSKSRPMLNGLSLLCGSLTHQCTLTFKHIIFRQFCWQLNADSFANNLFQA